MSLFVFLTFFHLLYFLLEFLNLIIVIFNNSNIDVISHHYNFLLSVYFMSDSVAKCFIYIYYIYIYKIYIKSHLVLRKNPGVLVLI